MPGLIVFTVATCPGALARLSRSLKWIVVLRPDTGPNAAASAASFVAKVPVEVTPSGVQPICASPVTVARTSATTPKVRRVSRSGWKSLVKTMPGTVRSAVPAPADRRWTIRTSATFTAFVGSYSVPPAVIVPSARRSVTSRAASVLKRGSAAASSTVIAPVSASTPPRRLQSPAAAPSSSGTLPIWPDPPAN